jgi:hypothetical protein
MARDKWPARLPPPPLRGAGTASVADLLAWSAEARAADLEIERARAFQVSLAAQQDIAAQWLEESIRRKDAACKAYTTLYGFSAQPSQPGSDVAGPSERALGKRKAAAMEVDDDEGDEGDDASVSRALGELGESGLAAMDF